MTDRDFYEMLRQRAVDLCQRAEQQLTLSAGNTKGSMSAHIAKERIQRMRKLARAMDALADVTEALGRIS